MAFVVLEKHEKGKKLEDLDKLDFKMIHSPDDELVKILKRHSQTTPC